MAQCRLPQILSQVRDQILELQSMSENRTAEQPAAEVLPDMREIHQEEISYHAVEKNGKITAIWEMRGRKHIRTIDPRSEEGRHLLGHTDNPEVVQNAQA
jgi:hypothetical protein